MAMQESQGEFLTYLSLGNDFIESGDHEQALGCYDFAFKAFTKIREDVFINSSQDLWLDALKRIRQINFFNISAQIRESFLDVLTAMRMSNNFGADIKEVAVSISFKMIDSRGIPTVDLNEYGHEYGHVYEYGYEYEENEEALNAVVISQAFFGGDEFLSEPSKEQPKLTLEEIDEKIQSFLSTVSKRYIEAMRACAKDQENPLWGGDIELIEIAKILQVQIIIHKKNIGDMQPTFGDKNSTQTIHLLLMGENYGIGHYCLLVPDEQNGFIQKGITADGDCLFNACLVGKRQLDAPTEAFRQSTPQEIRALRNNICDNLDVLLSDIRDNKPRENADDQFLYTEHDDPIKARFTAIIQGEESALSDHINDLPRSALVDEALELRNLKNPRQLDFNPTPNMFDSFIWEKKPSTEKRKLSFFLSDFESDAKPRSVKQKLEHDSVMEVYLYESGFEMPKIEEIEEVLEGVTYFSWGSKK